MKKKIVLLFTLLTGIALSSQTRNTISLKDNEKSEMAALQELSWIEGYWKGEAFGGIAEEIWSAPEAGSMMFVFRLIVDDKVAFYESGAIMETPEGLVLKLKHFYGDMKGWEEQNKTIDFKFVKIAANKVYFDGLTFEKAGEKEMNVYVVMREKDGTENEIKFNYQKQ